MGNCKRTLGDLSNSEFIFQPNKRLKQNIFFNPKWIENKLIMDDLRGSKINTKKRNKSILNDGESGSSKRFKNSNCEGEMAAVSTQLVPMRIPYCNDKNDPFNPVDYGFQIAKKSFCYFNGQEKAKEETAMVVYNPMNNCENKRNSF